MQVLEVVSVVLFISSPVAKLFWELRDAFQKNLSLFYEVCCGVNAVL